MHEPSGLRVESATEPDVLALAELFDRYRVFYGRASELEAAVGFVRHQVHEGPTRFFLAKLDGTQIGFVHVLPSFDTLAMRTAWILEDLYVDEAFRGRGAAAALLAHVESFASATGATRISLTTAHTNLPTQRRYVAHGYRLDETFRAYHRTVGEPLAAALSHDVEL